MSYSWIQSRLCSWGPWFIPRPQRRTGPYADAILICRELLPLLSPRWVPFLADLSCLRLSSLSLADQVPSWSFESPSVVLAVECASDPLAARDQASIVFFHWECLQCCVDSHLTSWFVILSFQKTLNMLPCHPWWAPSSRFNDVAVNGHDSALYRMVDRMTDSYNRILTIKRILLLFQTPLIFNDSCSKCPLCAADVLKDVNASHIALLIML